MGSDPLSGCDERQRCFETQHYALGLTCFCLLAQWRPNVEKVEANANANMVQTGHDGVVHARISEGLLIAPAPRI